MITLRRVLVPTDFSEPSAKALQYGRALAQAFGGALHVLHVVEEPFVQGWTVEGYVAMVPNLREALLEQAQARLAELVPPAERGPLVAAEVRVGRPHAELLRYAVRHPEHEFVAP
jgi:nucleotide-binding universal stress UspA family protein